MKENSIEKINATVYGSDVLSDEQISSLLNSTNATGHFSETAYQSGIADSPLKLRKKLLTKDILRKFLHIEIVHMTRAIDDDGVVKDFPIVGFVEYPDCYYTGGTRLKSFIITWAKAAGDIEPNDDDIFIGDRMLPCLNKEFNDYGAPGVIFTEVKGKKNTYIDVHVISG